MAKVMLVEDDNNLREIYEARLLAEGYEIVSAQDGEEALALAVKERPDLIIADIMMPKISGFDMLDILRSTPETKDTKVVMMTALGQAEDKERANKLGADRYLVKSQVTLEDVARVAHEVLEGLPAGQQSPAPTTTETTTSAAPAQTPAPEPITPDIAQPTLTAPTPATPQIPVAVPEPAATAPTQPPAEPAAVLPGAPSPVAPQPAAPIVATQIPVTITPDAPDTPPATQTAGQPPTPAVPDSPAPKDSNANNAMLADAAVSVSGNSEQASDAAKHSESQSAEPSPSDALSSTTEDDQPKTSVHTKVIKPINDLSKQGSDLDALLAKEEAIETNLKSVSNAATGSATIGEMSPTSATQPSFNSQQTAPTQSGAGPASTITPTNDPNSIAL